MEWYFSRAAVGVFGDGFQFDQLVAFELARAPGGEAVAMTA